MSVFALLLFLSNGVNAQITLIPDSQFEQVLIDQSYDSDGVVNGQVLTSDISSRTSLIINNYSVTNFEGLQDFSSLINFTVLYNYAETINPIDFSGNSQLLQIEIFDAPNLSEIDISQNLQLGYLQIFTQGELFNSIDVTNNINLVNLTVVYTAIDVLDVQYNTKLQNLNVNNNQITELDVSQLSLLQNLSANFNQIEELDLSNNDNLTSLTVTNGLLKRVNLKNNSNALITYLDLRNNPDLTCVLVEDASSAGTAANWYKDPTATYVDESISINTQAQDKNIQYESSGNYFLDIDEWIADNGGAEAASDCGDITWSNYINGFVHEDSNSIIYEVDFVATDVFGIIKSTFATLTVQNIKHFTDGFYGSGDTICDDVFDLNTVITNIDATASLNAADVDNISFARVSNGESNEGPSGGSFLGTKIDFPDTGAGSYSYLFKVSVEKSLTVYNPINGDFDQEIIDDEAFITLNDKTVAFETEELDGSTVCSDTISSIQDLTDLLTITPDPNVLEPQDGPIDLNLYWSPSVYSGAGTYTFDPTNAFPNCPSNAVIVTVLDANSSLIDETAEELIITYNPEGNDTEIDAWLANNGGATATGCSDITWEWELIDSQLNQSFGNPDDTFFVCTIEFKALDSNQNQIGTSTALLKYESFPSAGASLGNGGTLCETTSFDLNLLATANYNSAKFNSSNLDISQTGGFPGVSKTGTKVDFPDTGAGQFSYRFNVLVTTPISVGSTFSLDVESNADFTVGEVIIPFDPGPNITVELCDFDNVNLLNLYNELQIQLDVDTTEYNEAEDFGNIFEPENFWYNETDDLEANPNLPSLTEITEPGVYQFNAKKFLQDCAGEPVFVTLVESCDNTLNLKMILEGSFNTNTGLMKDDLRVAGVLPTISPYIDELTCNQTVFNVTGNNAIIDWVWLEIRDSGNLETIIKSTSALLQSDGDIVGLDGVSPLMINISSGNYNLMLSHRNHLGILSLNAINFDGTSKSIDFTNSSALVVGGSNAISDLGDGNFGLFSGDFNGDGQVQNTDKNGVEPLRGITGYSNADIDMNGEVQNTDINGSLNPNLGKGEQFTRNNLNAKRKGKPKNN